MPGNVWLVVGVLVVVVVRRISPVIGGVMGALAAIAVAAWGLSALEAGAEIGVLGFAIGRTTFLGFVVVWFGFEVWGVQRAWRVRKQRRAAAAADAAEATSSGDATDNAASGPRDSTSDA